MSVAFAIREVREAEAQVARRLGALGERHRADHDIFHMSRTLIRLHEANLEALAPFAERYEVEADPASAGDAQELPDDDDPGLLLLRDLRALYLLYTAASVNWVVLGQGAQVARDQPLLDTVTGCHEQTLRGMKWALTRLKEAAPQALAG